MDFLDFFFSNQRRTHDSRGHIICTVLIFFSLPCPGSKTLRLEFSLLEQGTRKRNRFLSPEEQAISKRGCCYLPLLHRTLKVDKTTSIWGIRKLRVRKANNLPSVRATEQQAPEQNWSLYAPEAGFCPPSCLPSLKCILSGWQLSSHCGVLKPLCSLHTSKVRRNSKAAANRYITAQHISTGARQEALNVILVTRAVIPRNLSSPAESYQHPLQ